MFSWSKVKKPVFVLAPMADITTMPFRSSCKKMGADIVFTLMISANAVLHNPDHAIRVAEFLPEEQPVIVQIFGYDGDLMGEAANIIDQKIKPAGIDLNLGCPAPKITGNDCGASSLKDLNKAADLVKKVRDKFPGQLSVKLRLGWREKEIFRPIRFTPPTRGGASSGQAFRSAQDDRGGFRASRNDKEISRPLRPCCHSGDLPRAERPESPLRQGFEGQADSPPEADRRAGMTKEEISRFTPPSSGGASSKNSVIARSAATWQSRDCFASARNDELNFCEVLERIGINAITIHGRTAKQGYSGEADWQAIYDIAKTLKISVIGNGDIDTWQKAYERLNGGNVIGVMIGRAALGNPWIFKAIKEKKDQEITKKEIARVIREQVSCHLKIVGNKKNRFLELRKHLGWYIRGFPGALELRKKAVMVESFEEIEDILAELLD